ncbi:MAG: TadE/TadG family type IV pilus assembly protein [Candidatus Binataceae bacterium]
MLCRDAIGASNRRNPGRRKALGQAMVEFAIVASVALALIFGIIQAALALYAYSFVSYAARAGVRYAMVHGNKSGSPATNSTVQTYVQGLAVALDTTSLTATTTWNPDENPGSTVTVRVTYTYRPLIWSTTLTMSSTSQGLISN